MWWMAVVGVVVGGRWCRAVAADRRRQARLAVRACRLRVVRRCGRHATTVAVRRHGLWGAAAIPGVATTLGRVAERAMRAGSRLPV
jgi:hypothetical protein